MKDNVELIKQWDYEKNQDLNLDKLTLGSDKVAWWKCEKGHSYDASIKSKAIGNLKCPICSNHRILKGYNDLATTNPELLNEWDYEKNSANNITPFNITKGAEKKIWWICQKCNQSYKCFPYSKKENKGCPYCSSKIIKKGINDIFTKMPKWKDSWDFDKNKKNRIDPYKYGRNSHKKVWWICSNCKKSFERSFSKTDDYVLCSSCSIDFGALKRIKSIIKKNGSLLDNYPEIANEWNYEKNGDLFPDSITSHSSQKVWWICPNGHSYKSSISNKINGNSCPKCSREKSISFPEKAIVFYLNKIDKNILESYRPTCLKGKEIDIFITKKNIGIEYDGKNWHKEKLRDIEKNKLCADNKIILYRIREKGCPVLNSTSKDLYVKSDDNYDSLNIIIFKLIKEIYNEQIDVNIDRDRFEILKLVSFTIKKKSLESLFPNISCEWDYDKNKGLLPSQFYSISSKKVWWICPNGHSYDCKICNRTLHNSGCPYCSNQRILNGYNDLATTNPELLKLWNYKKNNDLKIYPDKVSKGSHKKAWWVCSKGHEWESSISNIVKKRGCPYCSRSKVLIGYNDLATTNPELLIIWNYRKNDKFGLKPQNFLSGSSQKVWWICPKGHEWCQKIYHITNGIGCPKCKNDNISKKLSKKVYQYSLNGELIREYSSLVQAELETKINRSNISHACKNNKYTAGGFKWKHR